VFNKYYESELAYLRELGRGYAQAHPGTAGFLAERSGDPDVERLLEGFAFVAAKIRERTDDAVPEVVHELADLVLPHYLRPVPATTIVQFRPQARALRGPVPVPRGSELATVPVDGTPCLFRTTQEVTLLPLSVEETLHETPSATAPVLRVQLSTPVAGREALAAHGRLRLYIHGEYALASTLLLWLARHCRSISAGEPNGPGTRLPPDSLRLVGFGDDAALFPWPPLASRGYRVVQEYFTLPEKFLFFDLVNLDKVLPAKDRVELRFEFERPPALTQRVPRDVFRLHCVPAINLFRVDGDPIRLKAPGQEQLVRAAGVDPGHMEVYSVDQVLSVRAGVAERETVHPFTDFAHVGGSEVFYRLRRSASPIDEGVDTYLSLETPRDVAPRLEERTLSLELTCTNRALPKQLRLKDVNAAAPTSPTLAQFDNILPVSQPLRPPLGTELLWRVLAHVGLVKRSVSEPGLLSSLLGLYNFQAFGDEPVGRANSRRAESVQSVQVEPSRRLVQGALVRGQRTLVELDETGFVGPGDAFLFGCVLDELLSAHLTLNAFHTLRTRQLPSRTETEWTPRTGTQPLI
jgi:type VI secretion system protein ImpG